MREREMQRLRELAWRVRQIAELPIQAERRARWQSVNDLAGGKPVVLIKDFPWEQMEHGDELTNQIADEFLQNVETELLRRLYQWAHLQGDMVVEPVVYNPVLFTNSGYGVPEHAEELSKGIYASKRYLRVLDTEDDLEKIHTPEITVDWETTRANHQRLREIFDGILDVQDRGVARAGFAPWDTLLKWLGIEQGFMDLAFNPDFMHKAIAKLTAAQIGLLKQYEELQLLSSNNSNTVIGNGGYGYTGHLPAARTPVSLAEMWGHGQNQIFTSVSPAMQDEFAIAYEKPWLEQFGLTYYGCCEALHHKIDTLRKIRNLRKISLSPFADMRAGMEAIGKDYVVSFKPNSNILAADTWEPDAARIELEAACQQAQAYGCSMEIVMKTIVTVRNQPARLWEWSRIAHEVTEKYS